MDVRILVKMIDPLGVEGAGAPDDAVHFVTFFEEQFGEIGTVLTGDSCDEGFFTHVLASLTIPSVLQSFL